MPKQIAIDGPAGSGKSTVARQIARKLGYLYIDTGALYRAVTLIALRRDNDLNDPTVLADLAGSMPLEVKMKADGQPAYFIAGEEVTDELRSPEVNGKVSEVAQIAAVRKQVTQKLQTLAGRKGIVMDGRDIGTVVLPNAEVKVFLEADLSTRVKRRQQELQSRGFFLPTAAVEEEVRQRDLTDSARSEAPLKRAADAHIIDTTHLSPDAVVDAIIALIKRQKKSTRQKEGDCF
ncbi:MAG: (d)CMP kinase [Firmicutes bacterium]|nr:(d)CMP kinase [Bacillota bacterium]